MINQAGESFYIQTYNHFSMWLIQSVTGTGGWNATSASLLFPDMARLFGRPWFFLYTGLWGQCVCVCVCVRMQVCVMPLLSNLYFVCWVTSVMSDSFATLWTVARQAPLSMGFSGQEYWRGLPCSPPGDLLNPRIEPPVSYVSCLYFIGPLRLFMKLFLTTLDDSDFFFLPLLVWTSEVASVWLTCQQILYWLVISAIVCFYS